MLGQFCPVFPADRPAPPAPRGSLFRSCCRNPWTTNKVKELITAPDPVEWGFSVDLVMAIHRSGRPGARSVRRLAWNGPTSGGTKSAWMGSSVVGTGAMLQGLVGRALQVKHVKQSYGEEDVEVVITSCFMGKLKDLDNLYRAQQ